MGQNEDLAMIFSSILGNREASLQSRGFASGLSAHSNGSRAAVGAFRSGDRHLNHLAFKQIICMLAFQECVLCMYKGIKNNADSMNFAKRLRIVAERHGGLTRLAQKARINPSALSRYLNQSVFPNLSSAAAIAKAGHVSLDWLTTGKGAADTRERADEETVAFYELQASAGPGLLPENKEPPARMIPLPLAEIRRQTGVVSSDLCALLADGDSMEPTILNGALLLLDRGSQQPREGIYVITRGDDVLVKRIQPIGSRLLRLISDNPRYGREDVSLEDSSAPVRLIGRVIWIGQPL